MRFFAASLLLPLQLEVALAAGVRRGAQETKAAPTVLSSSDPLEDIVRSGIDQSLFSMHDSELSLVDDTQLTALASYIQEYSVDGRDDSTLAPPFDGQGRALMPGMDGMDPDQEMQHAHTHYVYSSCNSMLSIATCHPFSSYFDANTTALWSGANAAVAKIPCGECVTLDAAVGQPLEGATLNLDGGLDIVGKLVIPGGADVTVRTKYVFVQGELEMDPAPAPISSALSGPRTKIVLTGTEDLTFQPDHDTDNTHIGGEEVSHKAFVIAGGKLNVRSLDSTCPSWVKLQHIEYTGPSSSNLALNGNASASSECFGGLASNVIDGDDNTVNHSCEDIEGNWVMVDLGEDIVNYIQKIVIRNRLQRILHQFHIEILDAAENLVWTQYFDGELESGAAKDFIINDRTVGRFARMRYDGWLHIAEFEVWGYPIEPVGTNPPVDILTVGEDAARCWSAPGSRILLTSDTHNWDDQHVAVVADVPSAGPDTISVLPLLKKKTAADETFGYPDFASEVALLERSLIIEGEKEVGEFANLGGHLIVLHTPHIHQHLEGAMLENMGQHGRIGRYPLHFHMSDSVHGSTFAKNVIYKSNQRCIVVHGSHNATIDQNVAFDTKGHCFILEDGGEWNNTFSYNLGAKTDMLPSGVPREGESDHKPATFWITNPSNHFFGNVAAGSRGPGFWFELMMRAPSSNLAINQGVVHPKWLPLGTFDDNTAHSSGGIATYETGYHAPPGTTWRNIKSYKNKAPGLLHHGTDNIDMQGGILADNNEAARNFGHKNAIYNNVDIIGRSEHQQSMIDQFRSNAGCDQAGGVSLQPNQGMGFGTKITNSRFSGFDNECTGGKNYAIWLENDQVRNGVFDATHMILNNSFNSNNKALSACISINHSPENEVRHVIIEDSDGSMSGQGPGFFVQDDPAVTNFIDSPCQPIEGSCLLFCPNACLRLGVVLISQDMTTRGVNLTISDGTNSAATPRGEIWFDEMASFLNAPIPIVLSPGPTKFLSFVDASGQPTWPGYASIDLEREPVCTAPLSDVQFAMPEADGRCDVDFFAKDDYAAGVHGWQNCFTGIDVIGNSDGTYTIATNRRKHDEGNPGLQRTLDVSCLAPRGGHVINLSGKIRIQDANGADVACDPNTSADCPKLKLFFSDVWEKIWYLETNDDGNWAEFDLQVELPADLSSTTKALLYLSGAAKKEFLVSGWSMTTSTHPPTMSPSDVPTGNPTAFPTLHPTVTPAPTAGPTSRRTAAPVSTVPTNLALNGEASASSECYGGLASNVIDGDDNTVNHSCEGIEGNWVMVDLGEDTVNYIKKIVIRNHVQKILHQFHIDILDAAENLVWTQYFDGELGSGAVKDFIIDDGTAGRFARMRYDGWLHIAEFEVWGYPIELPTGPRSTNLALNGEASASSECYGGLASNVIDGNDNTINHSCEGIEGNWVMVDLGEDTVNYIKKIVIRNRLQRILNQFHIDILDAAENIVWTQYFDGELGSGVGKDFIIDDGTTGRFARMRYDGWLHIAEFEVWGYPI